MAVGEFTGDSEQGEKSRQLTPKLRAALERGLMQSAFSPLTAESFATVTLTRVTPRERPLHVWVATSAGTALRKRADKGISSPPFVTDYNDERQTLQIQS